MSDKKADKQFCRSDKSDQIIIGIKSERATVTTIPASTTNPNTPTSEIWQSIIIHPTCVICQKMIKYKQEQWTFIPDGLLDHKCPKTT